MEQLGPTFICLLIIAAVIVIVTLGLVMQHRRAEAFRELAKRLHLDYHKRSHRIPKTYSFLDALDCGHSRYAENILAGRYREHQVLAFDYHYTIGSGKHSTHIHFSFFMLRLPKSFPETRIYPENALSKIGQALGYADIDFESVEFSRAFTVRADDKKLAYDVCHMRMMEYLLDHRDISIEIERDWLAVWVNMKRMNPEEVPRWLDTLVEVREQFPKYLLA